MGLCGLVRRTRRPPPLHSTPHITADLKVNFLAVGEAAMNSSQFKDQKLHPKFQMFLAIGRSSLFRTVLPGPGTAGPDSHRSTSPRPASSAAPSGCI